MEKLVFVLIVAAILASSVYLLAIRPTIKESQTTKQMMALGVGKPLPVNLFGSLEDFTNWYISPSIGILAESINDANGLVHGRLITNMGENIDFQIPRRDVDVLLVPAGSGRFATITQKKNWFPKETAEAKLISQCCGLRIELDPQPDWELEEVEE